MLRSGLLVVVLFFWGMAIAQNNKTSTHVIKLCYLGENITHPGAQLGYVYNVSLNKSANQILELGGVLGGYSHPYNHRAIRLAPTIGYRFYTSGAWSFAFNVESGVFKRYYNGTVYEINDMGEVSEVSSAAKTAFHIGSFLSVSKQLSVSENSSWGCFLDVGIINEIKTAENPTILHPVLLFGLSYSIKNAKH
jgi:hypothetical protein